MSRTAIFDLEEDPPRPPRRRLRMLVAACIGLLLGGVLILADQGYLPDWHWPTANGLLLIPALYVTIAVHELGHALAGKLVGFDTGGIAIGGFVVLKSGKNWVVQFNWRCWTGGFFRPLTKTDELGISHYAWMIAGGPIASAILAVLCLAGLELYGNDPWSIAGTLFWTSLLAALGTAVPFSAGLQNSDGALLRMLLKDVEGTRGG